MHLIKGVQVHGNSARKKKKPLSANQMKKLEVEWRQYNKRMRQTHCHDMQFQDFNDYVAYTRGEYKPKKKKEFTDYAPTKSNVRDTKSYPSLKTSDTIPTGSTARKEPQQYTGDLLVGIGVMHKSNLVPIMRGTDEAKDIANMRR
jgi:activator of HSP90 ATPase